MQDTIIGFYDPLADYYPLIFEDWSSAIDRQAGALDALLRSRLGSRTFTILDCACGIGTQALGLAARGHRVVASDLSRHAVDRAIREAEERGVEIEFHVSDMTDLSEIRETDFDVVAALDNALPHLSAEELGKAVRSMRDKLKPGGILIASIRDYDTLIKTRPTVQGPAFYRDGKNRRIVHQLWDWTDNDRYTLHLYVTLQIENGWVSHHFVSEYRCLLRSELTSVLASAGFEEIQWEFPEKTSFYQPIVIASLAGQVKPTTHDARDAAQRGSRFPA